MSQETRTPEKNKKIREKIQEIIDIDMTRFETHSAESVSKLKRLLELSAGRVLYKHPEKLLGLRTATTFGKVAHISDWIMTSIINNEPWLSNVDELDRPKKLMKFSSIDQIVQEADKAMRIANEKLQNKLSIVTNEDEELIAELDNGYYIVRLLSPEALDRESAFMQHCIGNGSYDMRLNIEEYRYFSLRDSSGKPHATMECINEDGGFRIIQLQGKQNKIPLFKYIELMGDFFIKNNFTFPIHGSDFMYGKIIDINGKFYDKYNLPDNFKAFSAFSLNDYSGNRAIVLPNNLHARNIAIDGSQSLMNIKAIDGTAVFHNCDEILITSEMNIKDLIFIKCKNIKIEENVVIDGILKIENCSNIELPENLTINKDFWLEAENTIETLPKGMIVKEKLVLIDTKIKTIPNNLSNLTYFFTIDTPLNNLPDVMTVEKQFDITNADIKTGLKEIKHTHAMQSKIRNSKIENLPKATSLLLEDCTINHIPEVYETDTLTLDQSTIEHTAKNFTANRLSIVNDTSKGMPPLADNVNIRYMLYSSTLNFDDHNIQFADANYNVQKLSIGINYDLDQMDDDYLTIPDSISNETQLKILSKAEYMNVETVGEYREYQNNKKYKFSFR